VRVEVHDSHFPSNAKDEDWLLEIGNRGWVVLTKDRKFHNRILEITAIARSNARVFKLTAANLQGTEMAAIFVKAIRKIAPVAASNRGPSIATV
jgi:predicted nuclease of predicted toxin-antitoxin system